jgi:hypothetical protein
VCVCVCVKDQKFLCDQGTMTETVDICSVFRNSSRVRAVAFHFF